MTAERQWIRTDADTLRLSGTRITITHMFGDFMVTCGEWYEMCETLPAAKAMGEKWVEDFGELALEWKP